VLNAMGAVEFGARDYPAAESLLREALEIRKKILGDDHPDTGTAVGNLARVYYQQRRYTEGDVLYRKSLEILEHTLGPESRKLESALEEYARLLKRAENYSEAEKIQVKATRIHFANAMRNSVTPGE
jgi:tetratricopeptide (TPR) repeat protein